MESSDDFGVMETFVKLDMPIIFALHSFSISVIVLEILAKNGHFTHMFYL